MEDYLEVIHQKNGRIRLDTLKIVKLGFFPLIIKPNLKLNIKIYRRRYATITNAYLFLEMDGIWRYGKVVIIEVIIIQI